MPSGMLAVDTGFPTFTDEESTEEKVVTIQNYMYMLVESLRYSLRNLDLRNMNQKAVFDFSKAITEPIYIELGSLDESLTQISTSVDGLGVRVSNAEGKITELGVTVDGLGVRVSNAEGDVASLGVTVNGLSSRVSNLNGQVSSLTQTVEGFTLTAANEDSSSLLKLTSGGIVISSTTIRFTGMVTFNDLSGSGTTVINGDNIRSGTISGVTLISDNGSRYVAIQNGEVAIGEINRGNPLRAGSLYYDGTYVFLESSAGKPLKLFSATDMSIDAGPYQTVFIGSTVPQKVRIGGTNTVVEIKGDVTINGTPY